MHINDDQKDEREREREKTQLIPLKKVYSTHLSISFYPVWTHKTPSNTYSRSRFTCHIYLLNICEKLREYQCRCWLYGDVPCVCVFFILFFEQFLDEIDRIDMIETIFPYMCIWCEEKEKRKCDKQTQISTIEIRTNAKASREKWEAKW